ncbi:MAG: hypothetical protein ACOYOQ_00330 [Microthrixaceae bacterium]
MLRRVQVFASDTFGVDGDVVTPRDGDYYQEDDSDVGAFGLSVAATDTNADKVEEGAYITYRVTESEDTDPDFSTEPVDYVGVVEKVRVRVRDRNPGQLIREATGRSLFGELERFLVQPPLGRFQKPTPLEVRFDWTHPANRGGVPGLVGVEPQRSGLAYPTYQGSVFTADVAIFLGVPYTHPSSPQGRLKASPDGWPDPLGAWIWSRAADGNGAHPAGTSYFFGIIETFQLPMAAVWAADNNGALAVNGAVVDAGATPPASQWKQAAAIGIPEVTAGPTYIAARVENRAPYGPRNPGGFAFVAYQPIVSERFEFDNSVARTSNYTTTEYVYGAGSTNLTNCKLGAGWKCLDYPASPPGYTVGHAMRLLFRTIETYGGSTGWTLGFTDTLDSNGNTWEVTDGLVARVNDSIAEVCRQWSAQGRASFGVDWENRVLLAYRWREQGSYPSSSVTWTDDHLFGMTVEGRL